MDINCFLSIEKESYEYHAEWVMGLRIPEYEIGNETDDGKRREEKREDEVN